MSITKQLNLTDKVKIGETSSSEFPSEGGTPTFDTIPFRVFPGQKPPLNTFVVALRDNDAMVAHYGRIIKGMENNQRASPMGRQKSGAYGMEEQRVRSSEQSHDLVRVMEIELLGEIHFDGSKLDFSEPHQLPHTGQPVYELPANVIPSLLGIPYDQHNGLHLGDIASGGHTVPFFLPVEAMARHIAVLGKTGVGKSYAVGVLIEPRVWPKNLR